MPREQGRKLIAQNKKARHDYSILDTYEVGLVLTGTEVKSLRAGRASIVDGFASVDDGEVWLQHVHIPEYVAGTWTNHTPRRKRKVLMHRSEIDKLIGKIKERSEEHTSELQSRQYLVCRLLLEKKKKHET